jgi:CRP-like cAMP-binding protein
VPSFVGLFGIALGLLAAGASLALILALRRARPSPAVAALGRGHFAEVLETAQTGRGAARDDLCAAAVAAKHLLRLDVARALIDRVLAADPGDGEARLESGLIAAYVGDLITADRELLAAAGLRSDLAESITLHRAWLALRREPSDLRTARRSTKSRCPWRPSCGPTWAAASLSSPSGSSTPRPCGPRSELPPIPSARSGRPWPAAPPPRRASSRRSCCRPPWRTLLPFRYNSRTVSIQDLFRQWDLFSHFTAEQLAQLAGCAALVHYPPKAIILHEGEETLDPYFIQSGSVRIQRKTPYGKFALAVLGPGVLFGETSFIDHGPRTGDAVTAAESELLVFDPAVLQDLLERDQRFQLALYWTFWKSLSRKLRKTNENLTQFFSETRKPVAEEPITHFQPGGDIRVDLAAKRKLFAEQKLSNLEINFLTTLSKEKQFPAQQVIFREGETAHEMYVVLEGKVMISKFIPGAGEEALAFIERGGYFGEMALIDNAPRSADAKAYSEGAVVLAIPREVLEGILDINKVSSLRLLTILCNLVAQRLRELDEKVITWFILAGGSGISWPVDSPQGKPES